jgi:hypothetical protein
VEDVTKHTRERFESNRRPRYCTSEAQGRKGPEGRAELGKYNYFSFVGIYRRFYLVKYLSRFVAV